MCSHANSDGTFPNQTSDGAGLIGYVTSTATPANVAQSIITANFVATGWTEVAAAEITVGGLGTGLVTLDLTTPISARYIRLGIVNRMGNSATQTQVSQIRVFGGEPGEPVITHRISVTHSGRGIVRRQGGSPIASGSSTSVIDGNSVTLEFVPDNGNSIIDVKINDVSDQTAISTGRHTFSNVTANASVEVTFTDNSPGIDCSDMVEWVSGFGGANGYPVGTIVSHNGKFYRAIHAMFNTGSSGEPGVGSMWTHYWEEIECDNGNGTSIRNPQRRDESQGIIFSKNPTSDETEISVTEGTITRAIIYDALGNVVFNSAFRAPNPALNKVIWDLRNPAGRRVAEGSYLVVVEAMGMNGKLRRYSARLGVTR
jgi:hypothetical protein